MAANARSARRSMTGTPLWKWLIGKRLFFDFRLWLKDRWIGSVFLHEASANRVKLFTRMARLKTPQQKKKESYAHDRVEGGEYPHADRKNRPRIKALGQRQLRRTSRQMLSSQPEEVLQLSGRSHWTWLKSGVRLQEHLESTQKHRIEREAHNIFRRGYNPATHARFRRVMQSWLKGGSEQSALLAEFYSRVINQFPDEGQGPSYGQGWLPERRYFLKRFFSKEPELKRSFQSWIDQLKRTANPG